jgi:hypothetical protein
VAFAVNFCPVTVQDVLDWYTAFNNIVGSGGTLDNGASAGDTYFLFGYYDGEDAGNHAGVRNGTAQLDNSINRVLFPTVCGKHDSANGARSEEDKASGMYANIKRGSDTINIPNDKMQRKSATSRGNGLPHYDGHWICISADDLMDGDIVNFGGTGTNFKTDANYEIKK